MTCPNAPFNHTTPAYTPPPPLPSGANWQCRIRVDSLCPLFSLLASCHRSPHSSTDMGYIDATLGAAIVLADSHTVGEYPSTNYFILRTNANITEIDRLGWRKFKSICLKIGSASSMSSGLFRMCPGPSLRWALLKRIKRRRIINALFFLCVIIHPAPAETRTTVHIFTLVQNHSQCSYLFALDFFLCVPQQEIDQNGLKLPANRRQCLNKASDEKGEGRFFCVFLPFQLD